MLDQTDIFLTQGYAHFKEPGLLDLSKFNITNVEIDDTLENNFSIEEQAMIDQFVEYVSKKYVGSLYKNYEVVYYAVWDGVDQGSTEWHNDAVEGFDFNVLYYYDDTDETVGGQIELRNYEGEVCVYPKSGDLVFINQNGKFYHRANRSTAPRRVASIEYKVYE
jgi:hypothetical protein